MVSVGLIGQYGSELFVMNADHAIATINRAWQMPRSLRGLVLQRDMAEARLLPMPRPVRKTARMIENAYTLTPNSIDNNRVQITSAPRAAIPDRPMTR